RREQTADGPRKRDQARVKGCGKSAPLVWRQARHGKPHRVQDRAAPAAPSGVDDRSGRKGAGRSLAPHGADRVGNGAARETAARSGASPDTARATAFGLQATPIPRAPAPSLVRMGPAAFLRLIRAPRREPGVRRIARGNARHKAQGTRGAMGSATSPAGRGRRASETSESGEGYSFSFSSMLDRS